MNGWYDFVLVSGLLPTTDYGSDVFPVQITIKNDPSCLNGAQIATQRLD